MSSSNRYQNSDNTLKKSLQYSFIRIDSATISAEPGIDPDAVNLLIIKLYGIKIAGVTASSARLLNGYRLPELHQPPVLKYMPE